MRSATASPSALAWNCAPSWRSGRYSSGASTSTVSPACRPSPPSDEPHADRDRDERDAERGRQLQHRAREEADPQRPHRRPPVLARSPRRSTRRLRPAAVERAQRRQAAHDVEEVRREQPQRLPALPRALLGVAADQPHEDAARAAAYEHASAAETRGRSAPTQASTATGTSAGEHDLRQVAAEVRLEPVARPGPRPPRSRRSRRRRARPAGRAGAARRAPAAAPESTAAAARRPATSKPQASAPRAANASDEQDERRARRRRATRRRRRGRRSARAASPGASTSSAVAEPERGVGREQPARRPGAAEEARVERAHRLSRRRRSPARPRRGSSPPAARAEHVVRPALVEQHERRRRSARRRSSPRACSAPTRRSSTVRLFAKSGLETITRG